MVPRSLVTQILFGLFPALIFLTAESGAQVPAEFNPFIIRGFDLLDFATGDLNADNREDAVLVLRQGNEDSVFDDRLDRPLIILIRQPNGKLKQTVRNDSAVMARYEGGVFGDPYQEIRISRNGIDLYFYGGSAWRWAYEYRFDWEPATRNWYLTKETESSFNSTDPEMKIREVVINKTELPRLTLSAFSPGSGYREARWQVRAARTFFFDNPVMGSKPRKGYLVKGDIIRGTRELKNFIRAEFENKAGDITEGFILRRDLLPVK